jgi:hypothetical protein
VTFSSSSMVATGSVRIGVRTTRLPLTAIAVCAYLVFGTAASSGQTGVYTVGGGSASQTGQTYAATLADQSAIYVLASGHLILSGCTMTKSGDTSNVNNSSQYGINAGVLAASSGVVAISGGSVTTNASGGNGLFATGSGSAISMTDGTILASGGGAHGVDATYGGSITLVNVDITTTGSNASALATDFGGGNVAVVGGTILASSTVAGPHSAGIYSTGTIGVTGAVVTSLADCGGVIDGANVIWLKNTTLTGALEGIKIWKTAPASGAATVTLDGGSLTAVSGSAFYVTNEAGNPASADIYIKGGATIQAGAGNILDVRGSSTAALSADGVTLAGTFRADTGAAVSVNLENGTTFNGAASGVGIWLDASSVWTVTRNSVLTNLADPAGVSGFTITNIVGNGNDIHYDAGLSANAYLEGRTYALVNGGVLTPDAVSVVKETWGSIRSAFR